MNRLDIKPLSVNRAWVGKLKKTSAHIKYIRDVALLLKPQKVPDGYLELYLKFGFSSRASDFDNPLKPFIDCLQSKYGFDDKMIKRCVIEVDNVKRGQDYIEWELKPYAADE